MELGQLADLGEFIGGIAVLATLIYLVAELRHNTETARFSANVALHGNLNDLSPQFLDTETAPVIQQGMADFRSLTPDQQLHLTVFLYMVFSHGELVLLQQRRKRVDLDLVHRTHTVMAFYFGAPGVREWWFGTDQWVGLRDGFTAEYRDYIEKMELSWTNLMSADESQRGWNHPLAVQYGIDAIPRAILVDEEGKVLSMLARGPNLGRLLAELLGPVEDEE